MGKIHEFKASVVIRTGIEELFDFHTDTNNLPKISPAFPKVTILEIDDPPLREGSAVKIRLLLPLFPVDWHVRIGTLRRSELIVDVQEKGPFAYWVHEHQFKEVDGGVEMTDLVRFTPPFGILGTLALPFIRVQLKSMFTHRHKKTKNVFEG